MTIRVRTPHPRLAFAATLLGLVLFGLASAADAAEQNRILNDDLDVRVYRGLSPDTEFGVAPPAVQEDHGSSSSAAAPLAGGQRVQRDKGPKIKLHRAGGVKTNRIRTHRASRAANISRSSQIARGKTGSLAAKTITVHRAGKQPASKVKLHRAGQVGDRGIKVHR